MRIDPVVPSVILTSNCFLIVIWEFVRSTDLTLFLGNSVYKLLSSEEWKREDNILKLDGLIVVKGNPPSQIPQTVVPPEIVKEFLDTLSTLA